MVSLILYVTLLYDLDKILHHSSLTSLTSLSFFNTPPNQSTYPSLLYGIYIHSCPYSLSPFSIFILPSYSNRPYSFLNNHTRYHSLTHTYHTIYKHLLNHTYTLLISQPSHASTSSILHTHSHSHTLLTYSIHHTLSTYHTYIQLPFHLPTRYHAKSNEVFRSFAIFCDLFTHYSFSLQTLHNHTYTFTHSIT